MRCLKCEHENASDNRFCEGCGARLPWLAQEKPPSLQVEEGNHYVIPQRHYPLQFMLDLHLASFEYLDEGGSLQRVVDAFQVVSAKVRRFIHLEAPAWLSNLAAEEVDYPEYAYPQQMGYLLRKGCQLAHQGLEAFHSFLADPVEERLMPALQQLQSGHDHFGLAWELLETRLRVLEEEMSKRRLLAA